MNAYSVNVSSQADAEDYFKANCPYCNIEITGFWDWDNGSICIQGYCLNCKIFILEDEADWVKKDKHE